MTGEQPPELVEGVVVLDAPPPLRQRGSVTLSPAVMQKAALVSVGLAASATALAVARRRKVRRLARRRRRVLAPVLASRSFLVDVHMLGERK